MPVQRPEIGGAGLGGTGQRDPRRAVGRRRRNRHNRIGKLLPTGLVDQHDPRLDHQVSIVRRDAPVLEFNEINDCSHIPNSARSITGSNTETGLMARTVRCSPGSVNRKLYYDFFTYPAREGLRSPFTAFSAARLISDA